MVIYLENIESIKKLIKSTHILSRIIGYGVNIKKSHFYMSSTNKK